MSTQNCYQHIKEIMSSAQKGTVFATIDFIDCGSSDAVRKSLSRLVRDGFCQRILPGIFYRPPYSLLLKKEVAPAAYDVAHALARNYDWKLIPSPIHSQNELGISTQVPAKVIFTSTGPSRKYNVYGLTIELRQSRSKFVNRMSYMSALVTNALQDLKPFGINADTVDIVSRKLSSEEKAILSKELRFAPVWLQPTLEQIAMS